MTNEQIVDRLYSIAVKSGRVLEPRPVVDGMEDLAEKASTLLKYYRLQGAVSHDLRDALVKLQIEVLDPKAVADYQRAIQKLKNRFHWINKWNWHGTGIEYYREPIPEFVLRKAVQIKEEVQRCVISVEYLVRETEWTRINYPDPFLVAECDDEKYYIEVWDEPKFEGRFSK